MRSVTYYNDHFYGDAHRFHVHVLGVPDEPHTVVVGLSAHTGHDGSTVGLTVAETVALRDLLTAAIEAEA